MKKLTTNVSKPISIGLCLMFLILTNITKAAPPTLYFDQNGTTSGYGTSGAWDGANWAATSGGTATTASWAGGDFAEFKTTGSYTVTVGSDELMAGLFQDGGGTMTINDDGSGNGTLDITTTGGTVLTNSSGATVANVQGFLMYGGAVINETISGSGGVDPEYDATGAALSLFGNNTYSGGTALTSSSTLVNFNNNNSFGSGNMVVDIASGSYVPLLSTGGATITLANNFVNLVNGGGVNFASAANTPVVSTGNWSLGTHSLNLRNNGNSTAPLTLSGVVSGTNALLTVSGVNGGKINLNNKNTLTGGIAIGVSGFTNITLALGIANSIQGITNLNIYSGAAFALNGFDQAMNNTTLSLTAGKTSTIDFGPNVCELDLANSSAVGWNGGILDLTDWISGDVLKIGTDDTGVTSQQLSEIEFNGAGLGTASIDSFGDINSVPEPSVIGLGAIGGLCTLFAFRRRKL